MLRDIRNLFRLEKKYKPVKDITLRKIIINQLV